MSRYYESPNFLYIISAGMLATTINNYDLTETKPESEKYLNLNGITIDNLSNNSLKLYLNQGTNPYFIAPNTSRTFEGVSYRSFSVENTDAVVTNKDIYISCYRSVSVVDILKQMGKRQGLFLKTEDYINNFGVLPK